jgi:hypothetical protein
MRCAIELSFKTMEARMRSTSLAIFFLMLFATFSFAEEYFCDAFPEQMQVIGQVTEVISANNCDAYSCTVKKEDSFCIIKMELVSFWQHGLKNYTYFDRNYPIQVVGKNSCPTKGSQVSGVLCRNYTGNVYLEAEY